jgi:hypothetical protein
MELVALKDKLESLTKEKQIALARLLLRKQVVYDENTNGMFFNLSILSPEVLKEVEDWLEEESRVNLP